MNNGINNISQSLTISLSFENCVFSFVTLVLRTKYAESCIGRGGATFWQPRSPSVTYLDFYLRETVKEKVYSIETSSHEKLA